MKMGVFIKEHRRFRGKTIQRIQLCPEPCTSLPEPHDWGDTQSDDVLTYPSSSGCCLESGLVMGQLSGVQELGFWP